MEKKTAKITANANVVQFLSKSSNLAAHLPEWKRGVLEASSQATNSEPRTPVVKTEHSSSKSGQQ